MRNNFEKPRKFKCCGCGLIFEIKKVLDEEDGKDLDDYNYEIIQHDYDDNGMYCGELSQDSAEQIFCPRCGDEESFPEDVPIQDVLKNIVSAWFNLTEDQQKLVASNFAGLEKIGREKAEAHRQLRELNECLEDFLKGDTNNEK